MNERSVAASVFLALATGIAFGSACSDDATTPPIQPGTGGSSASGSGGSSTGSGGGASGTGGSMGETGGADGSGGGAETGGSAGASTGGSGGIEADGGGGGSPPLGDAGGGDLAQWQYFKTLQLDTTSAGANVTGDVPKYPVPVVLSAANFDFSQAKDQGADLRFSTPEGTPLPYAIEFWDSTAKVAGIWVKVDVKGNQKTPIIMSWGNASASDASDSHAVFDTNDGFVGVWHLSETGSTTKSAYKDATANAADATGIAMQAASVADGRVGKAASMVHAQNQYIKVESADSNKLFDIFNQMTYSIWVQPKSHTVEYQCMFAKGEKGFRIHYYGDASWEENKNKHITEICVAGSGSQCAVNPGAGTDVANGQWFHLVGVHDHPDQIYYVNGKLEKQESDSTAWHSDATKPVMIGNNSSLLTRSFDGLLDEARVMNVPKNIHWVKLEFESQRAGQKFVTAETTQKRF